MENQPLQINIHSRDVPMTPSIREWAERRILFALGQFGTRIRAVWVRLSDDNGPKGGADQRCQMEAKLSSAGCVVATVRGPDLHAAVSRTAERLARRVRRELERARGDRRTSDVPKPDGFRRRRSNSTIATGDES
jgi:ribosomal subunit interface protein